MEDQYKMSTLGLRRELRMIRIQHLDELIQFPRKCPSCPGRAKIRGDMCREMTPERPRIFDPKCIGDITDRAERILEESRREQHSRGKKNGVG
jgi:hypothetical protein